VHGVQWRRIFAPAGQRDRVPKRVALRDAIGSRSAIDEAVDQEDAERLDPEAEMRGARSECTHTVRAAVLMARRAELLPTVKPRNCRAFEGATAIWLRSRSAPWRDPLR